MIDCMCTWQVEYTTKTTNTKRSTTTIQEFRETKSIFTVQKSLQYPTIFLC